MQNFRDVLTNDVNFPPALWQSLMDLVNIPIVIIFSLFVATLLNRKIRFRGFFRVAFLLPILIGTGAVMEALTQDNSAQVTVVMGSVSQAADVLDKMSFKDLVLNDQLKSLMGPDLAGFVGNIINTISDVMWMSGIQIIIFLGVLQTIPNELYEASVVDGASEFDKLWKITLPLTMPAIQLNVVYTLIDSFTNSNNQVISYVSQVSFTNFLLSYGSAMSWMYFLIIGVILAISFAIMRRYTFYMG